MSIVKIIEESSSLPLELEEIKSFLKLDYEEDENEDIIVIRSFKTAIKQCENIINQSIIEKTYKYCVYEEMKDNFIKLLYGTVNSIKSVKIITKSNEEIEMVQNNYFLDQNNNTIYFKNKPFNYLRIEIEYDAKIQVIHEDLLQAILFHTTKIYEDKTGYCQIPRGSLSIYKKYKIINL